jgi:hypothetical protein
VAGTSTTGTEPRFDSRRPFRPTDSYTNPRDVTVSLGRRALGLRAMVT